MVSDKSQKYRGKRFWGKRDCIRGIKTPYRGNLKPEPKVEKFRIKKKKGEESKEKRINKPEWGLYGLEKKGPGKRFGGGEGLKKPRFSKRPQEGGQNTGGSPVKMGGPKAAGA